MKKYKVLGFPINIKAGEVDIPDNAIPLNLDYTGQDQTTLLIQCLIPVKKAETEEEKAAKKKAAEKAE